MRWIPLVMLLYCALGLQVAEFGSLGGAGGSPRIEYLPLLALFYALYAQDDAAPLAGLCCGLAYDWIALMTPGTFALPLALVAWLVVRVRLSIFREHRITQFFITFLAIVAFAGATILLRGLLTGIFGLPGQAFLTWKFFLQMTANALYTAALAPLVFWPLSRIRGFLGFAVHGPRSHTR